ncbi:MAG: hypothetical protein HYV36_06585 [Lentisphaerae bacterium]|nr:hypothetical protein [Lentisphaerota bacterium]
MTKRTNNVRFKNWMRHCPRRMMVGLHVPDYDQIQDFAALKKELAIPDILEKIDPRAIARAIKAAHIQAFWFYAKCHYGNAYYPSKVGHVHSALKGRDLFGELVEECLSEGIVPLAVYEFSDLRMPKDHPDWCHKIPDHPGFGKVEVTDAAQGARVGGACLNGPYGDYAFEQALEVIRHYPIKGYYIDFLGLFGFEKWICPYCNPKLRKVLGRDFPGTAQLSHAEYVRYQQWRLAQNDAYAQRIRKAIKDLRPDVAFVHNFHGFWGPGDMQGFDFAARNCDFLTADLFQLRDGMLQMSWKLRTLAGGSQLRPAEALLDSMTAIQCDYCTPKALDSYNAELWTARSTNVATCTSFMINLDGTFHRGIFALNEKIMREHEACEPWLNAMQPLATVGLLRSNRSLSFRPPEKVKTPVKLLHHQFEMEGWAQVLVASHQLWDMVDESQLTQEYLRRFRVLILPNVSCLGRKEAAVIAAFVKNGGTLVATGDTSLFDADGKPQADFQLAAVFGAHFVADRRPENIHLIIEEPTLVPAEPWVDPSLCLTDGQLEVRAAPHAACLGRVGRKSATNIFALQMFPTSAPGLIRHAYGRGQCWYFAGKPALQFRYYGQNNVKRLLKTILAQAVGPVVPVWLEAPDTVELFAHRQKGSNHIVVNLVHAVWGVSRSAGGFINLNGKKGPSRFDEVEQMPRLYEVRLHFPDAGGQKIGKVYLAPDCKPLRLKRGRNETMVVLRDLGVHVMVVAEYA